MNMAEYGSQRSEQSQNVNFKPMIRGLKMICLTGTKSKICFIYVTFKCKIKNGVKMDAKKCH